MPSNGRILRLRENPPVVDIETIKKQIRKNLAADTMTQLNLHSLTELRSMNVPPTDDSYKYNYKATEDEGDGNYSFEFCTAKILAIFGAGGSFVEDVVTGEVCSLILDRTCFYAEQGGQTFDQGYMTLQSNDGLTATFYVQKVILQKGGYILHYGVIDEGSFHVGDVVALSYDRTRRRLTMNNHTSAHILDHALVEVLGSKYHVKGSSVTPDRLQLDFSSKRAMTEERVREIEYMVVDVIKQNVPVYTKYCKQEDARKIVGLITLANVDYPDPARVVSVGESIDALIENPESEASLHTSVDFCGGTHVHRSGHIENFVIASEEALSKGFRRIVALSGPGVVKAMHEADMLLEKTLDLRYSFHNEKDSKRNWRREWTELSQVVFASVIPYDRKTEIQSDLDKLKRIIDEKERTAKKYQIMTSVVDAEILATEYSSASFMVESLDADSNKEAVEAALKKVRCLEKNLCVMFLSVDEVAKKIFAMCTVTTDASEKGFTADKWIKSVTATMNGRGGGNPKWAQASGSDYKKLERAIDEARRFAAEYFNRELADHSLTNSGTRFSHILSLSDVYELRKLITEQFSSEAKEQSASLSCNGASYYFCDESFKGGSDIFQRAAVLRWISFADFTLWPSVYANLRRPEFDPRTVAFHRLAEHLKYLESVLETDAFLQNHKLSLADIAVFTCLLPLLRLEGNLKITERKYMNVYRWFRTIYHHPHVGRLNSSCIAENV